MEKSKAYIIALAAFVVCGGLGFGVTKVVQNLNAGTNDSEIVADGGEIASPTDDSSAVNEGQASEDTKPADEQAGQDASGQVADNQAQLEAEAAKAEAAARAEAEAKAKAKEAEKKLKEAEARAASNRQSYEELTAIINNKSNQNYPRNISIRYTNLDSENEEAQTSIANIRGYIRTGVWKSVTVVGATYDQKTGKVTSLTLQINR